MVSGYLQGKAFLDRVEPRPPSSEDMEAQGPAVLQLLLLLSLSGLGPSSASTGPCDPLLIVPVALSSLCKSFYLRICWPETVLLGE